MFCSFERRFRFCIVDRQTAPRGLLVLDRIRAGCRQGSPRHYRSANGSAAAADNSGSTRPLRRASRGPLWEAGGHFLIEAISRERSSLHKGFIVSERLIASMPIPTNQKWVCMRKTLVRATIGVVLGFVVQFVVAAGLVIFRNYDGELPSCAEPPEFYQQAVLDHFKRNNMSTEGLEFIEGSVYDPRLSMIALRQGWGEYYALVDCRGNLEFSRKSK